MEQKTNPLASHQVPKENNIKKSLKQKPNQVGARIVAFVAVFCLLAALAVVRNGSLFGEDANSFFFSGKTAIVDKQDSVSALGYNGTQEIINTTELGKDIAGYAGPVPLEIYVTDGKIDSIVALSNSESPKFFARLESSGLTHAWDGKTLKEAQTMDIDAVSGATYSSNAFIANVRAGLHLPKVPKLQLPAMSL